MPEQTTVPTSSLLCPMCGSGGLEAEVYRGAALRARYLSTIAHLCSCSSCRHQFFYPFLKEEEQHRVYAGSYFMGPSEVESYVKLYRAPELALARDYAEVIRRYVPSAPARVHEFGCGTGLTVFHLNKLGFDATGSDWSDMAIAFGREQGNTRIVNDKAEGFGAVNLTNLDAIYTNHVLEHINDTASFLRVLRGHMSERTILIQRVPNGRNMTALSFGPHFNWYFYFPHHVHYFSPRSLLALHESAGLKPIRIRCTSALDEPLARCALRYPASSLRGALVEQLALDFLTDELEIISVREDSARHPAELPADVPEFSPPAHSGAPVPAENTYDSFYSENGSFKRYVAHYNEFPCTMRATEFNPEANYYFCNQAEIRDASLFDGGAGTQPVLAWEAQSTGLFRVDIEACIKHAGKGAYDVSVHVNANPKFHAEVDFIDPRNFQIFVEARPHDWILLSARKLGSEYQVLRFLAGITPVAEKDRQ